MSKNIGALYGLFQCSYSIHLITGDSCGLAANMPVIFKPNSK